MGLGIDAECLEKGRQRCSMIWAALRGLQLPHIEVLCLSPQFQPQICITRSTTLEQQERVKGPRTTGAATAELAAGSHRWYRLALDHAQPGSSQHFLLSYVSMALAHKVTSAFYLDFTSRNRCPMRRAAQYKIMNLLKMLQDFLCVVLLCC